MYGDGISVWLDPKSNRWIVQCRIVHPGQKPLKIQRRARSKREAIRIGQELRLSASSARRKVTLQTFDLVLEKYAAEKKYEVQESTLSNYVHLLRLYGATVFGSRDFRSITAAEISELLVSLRARGLSASTVNTIRSRFVDLFKFAKQRGHTDLALENCVKRHKVNHTTNSKVQMPWSVDECRKALAAFKGSALEVFVSIALTTGMRKGEILALRWGDISEKDNSLRITKSRGEKRLLTVDGRFVTKMVEGSTKTVSSLRTLELNPVVLEALERHKVQLQHLGIDVLPESYVVVGEKGNPISLSALHRTFKRVCLHEGLRLIRVHDMRHTVAVLALEAGADLVEVSQGLGHSGVEITKRVYAPIVPGLSDRFTSRVYEVLSMPPTVSQRQD
jgi:integrase